ncbi:hypothetical protein XENORESO_004150 [Xenotaenia resolanae]|uniref:Uncharacterized protein n=1 Tax=Xenotaenia resolanae TaxID=208358 RepID=A0ABV0VP98_9TELE
MSPLISSCTHRNFGILSYFHITSVSKPNIVIHCHYMSALNFTMKAKNENVFNMFHLHVKHNRHTKHCNHVYHKVVPHLGYELSVIDFQFFTSFLSVLLSEDESSGLNCCLSSEDRFR